MPEAKQAQQASGPKMVLLHEGEPARLEAPAFQPWLAKTTCIILRDPGGEAAGAQVKAWQNRGIEVLVNDPLTLEQAQAYDGALLTAFGKAEHKTMQALQPRWTVGLGGIHDRHSAMIGGEAEPDFILFGGPELSKAPSLEERLEFLYWWQGLFVVPLVTFAASTEEAEALFAADADFVAIQTEDLV